MRRFTTLSITLLLSTLLMISCAGPAPEKTTGEEIMNSSDGENQAENASGNQNTQVKQDERFIALPGSFESVLLNWEPIAGAEKYLLEINITDEQYLPLAILGGESTSFEDTDVPAETTFTYKLTAISGGNRGESRQATLTTPTQVIDPLKVTLEFDQTLPAVDLSNIDPDNFDPSAIATLFPMDELMENAENGEFGIDPSMFVPSPITATSVISPSGGEISVTASNGIMYTLTVPAGALPFEMPITLRPISAIPDLPFSGGMDAAVFIEPEDIPFYTPATLTILAPEGYVPTAGELSLGFAFQAEGEELHLYPLMEDEASASTSGAHFGKKIMTAPAAGPLEKIAQQQLEKAGGYGKGSGSTQDLKKVNNRPSSKAGNRAAARSATAQQKSKFVQPLDDDEDELAPLPSLEQMEFAKQGNAINQKLSKADNWDKLLESIEEFSEYYNKGGSKQNQELNNRLLDELVKKANSFLSKNQAQCLSADDLKAQSLVERLINPGSPAMKAVAGRFKEKYGEKILNELTYMMKACSFELDLKSSISYEAFGSTRFTSAEATGVPLIPIYVNGGVYLFGSGPVKLEQYDAGVCRYPVQQYDNLTLAIRKLVPVFKDGKLVDFVLRDYWVAGMEQLNGVKVTEGENCPSMIKYQGGGDFWTGFFTSARATFGNFTLIDWKIQGDTTQGGAVTAKWIAVNPSFNPMGAGGKMSEDSKLTIRIRPYNRK